MRVLGVFAGLVTVTASSLALAQSPSPARRPGTFASNGRLAIHRAQDAFTSHDLDAAQTAYRAAQSEEHERAEGTLGLAYLAVARNDVDGALTAFRQAGQQAVTAGDDVTRVRALQGLADVFERAGRWSDAVTAWQDYLAFVATHPSLGSATNANARITAIRARDERDAAAAPVRDRIAQRLQQNAHPAP